MEKIIVEPADAGSRLDKFLIGKIDGSRSEIQRRIKAGAILVNDKRAAPHHFLRAGDVLEINPAAPPLSKGRNRSLPPNKGESEGVTNTNIDIIYESPDYLVVAKPAGLLTHETDKEKGASLADYLAKKYPELARVGEPERPGIVHRLDREVSGLLIVARSPKGYDFFKKALETHEIKKEYIALVYGELANDAGDITFKIGRGKGGKMAARAASQAGREALTKFDVIKKFAGYTLLRLQIVTGRTHQIRVHLKALGHPVVGDTLYGKVSGKFKKIPLDRIFLHAEHLAFTDPDGIKQDFKKALPDELTNILNQLK